MKTRLRLFIFLANFVCFNVHAIPFDHINISDGLSNPDIRCIIKDADGFMWFGTHNGLNRFDGYDIKVYMHDPRDSTSISGKTISCLFKDSRKNLWVGTWGDGLNLYRPETDDFANFTFDKVINGTLSHNWIMCMFEDSKGRLWVGTQNGLNLYNYKDNTFSSYFTNFFQTNNPSLLKRNSITDIAEDDFGNLWITTWSGLIMFNPENNLRLYYTQYKNIKNGFKTDRLETIYCDEQNNLWIGARGRLYKINIEYKQDTAVLNFVNYKITKSGANIMIKDIESDQNNNLWIATKNGLLYFDKTKESFIEYSNNPEDPATISSNLHHCLYLDENNVLWIGTNNKGVNILNSNRKKFTYDFPYINKTTNPDIRIVKSIYKDTRGRLWVGTDYGLLEYSKEERLLQTYTYNPKKENGIALGGVSGIAEDSLGNIWISNWGGGISMFDKTNAVFNIYNRPEGDNLNDKIPGSIAIQCMISDHNGNFWTGSSSGFLDKFNPYTRKFKHHFIYDKDSLRGVRVVSIVAQKNGLIWAAAKPEGGLVKIDDKTGTVYRYFEDDAPHTGLNTNQILTLYVDSKDVLWAGTDIGLFRYNNNTDYFTKVSGIKGLPEKSILSIQEDNQNHLWLSTPLHLIKFRNSDSTIVIYDESDGYPVASSVSFFSNDGFIYLGGINGLIKFNPSNVPSNTKEPRIVFTNFKIRNQPVSYGVENSPLIKPLNQLESLTLNHKEAYFSFQFAALNYQQTEKNQYAYKLEGLDTDWNYIGTRRDAYYTNVPPGDYTFKVIGSNNDGVWNDKGKSIQITIKPPWFQTYWAYSLYFILVTGIIFTFLKVMLMRQNLKNEIAFKQLEMENQQALAMKEHEVTEEKLKFFTNISHEFRTPLSLILGPIEKIYRSGKFVDKEANELMPLIYRNSKRLLILIEQLLTFRKLNNSVQKLNAQQLDIVGFIKNVLGYYENSVFDKKLKIIQQYNSQNMKAWFDPFKMEQILHNLFSNSFKYACHEGEIRITVEEISENGAESLKERAPWIKISIFNTAEYIEPEKLAKIFERFYQVDQKSGGTGIGLSMAKSLVELHHGFIKVESSEELQGVEFILYLPQDDRFLSEDEKISDGEYNQIGRELISLGETKVLPTSNSKPNEKKCREHEILIIEDNRELNDFLKQSLSDNYMVKSAETGESGLLLAEESVPDIIISDVIMPGMNGFEVVRHIKNNLKTCHIPVILLTAKTTDEDKISGYNSGADAYVEKPFNLNVLNAQVARVIKNREIMQRNYKQWIREEIKPDKISNEDHSFIVLVNNQIETNISKGDFSVNELAELVGLSTTQIYRKVKALTGYTPIEYIRIYKLKKAKNLLANIKFSIKEVTFMTGFNDPSYFGKCFKNEYGITPQNYRSKHVNYIVENQDLS